jgi:hypothetical protein
MSYATETAGRYRHHAAKLRLIAAKYDGLETVAMLTAVAKDYEQMAQAFDGMDVKNVTLLRPRNSN